MSPAFSSAMISIALTGAIVTGPLPAQSSLSNFTGRWVVDPAPSSNTPLIPICNRKCVITQSADTLITDEFVRIRTFKLDGSPQVTTALSPDGESVTSTFTARWDRTTLVITHSVTSARARSKEVKSVARLSVNEGRLTIEGTRPGRGGGADELYKFVFRRVD
jgi:hypothetical protein